jgi:RNA polymerase sigma-70 factor (sigma-E family)
MWERETGAYMRAEVERGYVEYLQARLPMLHRTAYLLCGNSHLAEDVVQSTALTLYRKWQTVEMADNVDAYVHRMLVNQLLGEWRRPWSRVLLTNEPPERPEPPRPGYPAGEGEEVRAALGKLGPRQRAVLVLRFFCDLSVEDTAAALQCSSGN